MDIEKNYNLSKYRNLFHGTAAHFDLNSISNRFGGGELGKGFYCSNSFHEAKAWAHFKDKTVIHFLVEIKDILEIDTNFLSEYEAFELYYKIKKNKAERTYVNGNDILHSNILGKKLEGITQYKWESNESIDLINSDKVEKERINETRGYRIIFIPGN